ncbi:hypothetical protein CHCC20335_3386 [Bacillus paralicheniformis]|nr:hypothetical protein CHCC20335_3386 [Bacillus paralicheniformis]
MLKDIDVYRAVNATEENQLFRIYGNPNFACTAGRKQVTKKPS